jgi:hypothetical protein
MFLCDNGGCSRIFDTTSQGSTTDVLQLSGSRSQTSDNVSQGATMSMTFPSNFF